MGHVFGIFALALFVFEILTCQMCDTVYILVSDVIKILFSQEKDLARHIISSRQRLRPIPYHARPKSKQKHLVSPLAVVIIIAFVDVIAMYLELKVEIKY